MCCIHATFELFYCLLFNLNLNLYEFEFKLNMFESFQKWKCLPFSPLIFSPAGPSLRFLFSFLFFPAAQKTIPRRPKTFPSPAQLAPPLPHRQTGGPRPSGPSPSSGSSGTPAQGVPAAHAPPRLPWPARRGLVPALFKCRATPLEPFFEAAAASRAKP